MKELKTQLKRFFVEEEGQSTTEYILILSVVVMIAMKFKKSFGTMLESKVTALGQKIESGIDAE